MKPIVILKISQLTQMLAEKRLLQFFYMDTEILTHAKCFETNYFILSYEKRLG